MDIPNGAAITLLEVTNDEWYEVSYGRTGGYVMSKYVTDESKEEQTTVYSDHGATVFVRAKPDENATILVYGGARTVITVLSEKDGWAHVRCEDADGKKVEGYIRSKAISNHNQSPCTEVVTELDIMGVITQKQPLYVWPSTKESKTVTLPEGCNIRVICRYVETEGGGLEIPHYIFDYYDETGTYSYGVIVHAYTGNVLYICANLTGEGNG